MIKIKHMAILGVLAGSSLCACVNSLTEVAKEASFEQSALVPVSKGDTLAELVPLSKGDTIAQAHFPTFRGVATATIKGQFQYTSSTKNQLNLSFKDALEEDILIELTTSPSGEFEILAVPQDRLFMIEAQGVLGEKYLARAYCVVSTVNAGREVRADLTAESTSIAVLFKGLQQAGEEVDLFSPKKVQDNFTELMTILSQETQNTPGQSLSYYLQQPVFQKAIQQLQSEKSNWRTEGSV